MLSTIDSLRHKQIWHHEIWIYNLWQLALVEAMVLGMSKLQWVPGLVIIVGYVGFKMYRSLRRA